MNEYQKAADDAKRLLSGFKGVAILADAFDKVGSLVQAEKDAKASLEALGLKIAEAQQALADVKSEAANVIATAMSEAEVLRTKAKTDADKFLSDAKKAATKAQTKAEEKVTWALEREKTVDEAAAEKWAKQEALTKELADLEDKIARAKAKVQELLGA